VDEPPFLQKKRPPPGRGSTCRRFSAGHPRLPVGGIQGDRASPAAVAAEADDDAPVLVDDSLDVPHVDDDAHAVGEEQSHLLRHHAEAPGRVGVACLGAVHLYQPRAEADKGAPALQVDAGLAALPLLEVRQEFGPGQLHTPSPFLHPHGYTASDSETDWRKGMRMVRNATLSSAGASATGAKGSER